MNIDYEGGAGVVAITITDKYASSLVEWEHS